MVKRVLLVEVCLVAVAAKRVGSALIYFYEQWWRRRKPKLLSVRAEGFRNTSNVVATKTAMNTK